MIINILYKSWVKVEFYLNFLEDCIKNSQQISKIIENHNDTIEEIDKLFNLLFYIEEKTVDSIAQIIINSKWSKTKDNVYELAEFIIQVLQAKIELHSYMID